MTAGLARQAIAARKESNFDLPRISLDGFIGMADTWLRTNNRPIHFQLIPALLWTSIGAAFCLVGTPGPGRWWGGLLLVGTGLVWLLLLLLIRNAPRIACSRDHLFLYIRSGRPVEIPLDAVECFFLGQGPSGIATPNGESEATNVIVRLADRAVEWKSGDTARRLAHWCDGYVTISGTWCEPINGEVVGQLNSLLVERKRSLKTRGDSPATAQGADD
ncbi:MAG: hypothetical protein KDA60_00110 [Planctomycetales bacterium]|nr:hypothetical protein [Planctomycetales bacterium]